MLSHTLTRKTWPSTTSFFFSRSRVIKENIALTRVKRLKYCFVTAANVSWFKECRATAVYKLTYQHIVHAKLSVFIIIIWPRFQHNSFFEINFLAVQICVLLVKMSRTFASLVLAWFAKMVVINLILLEKNSRLRLLIP